MNRRTCIALVCFVAVVLAIKLYQPKPFVFDSMATCKERLEAKGLYCVQVADHEYSYLVISATPLTLAEARTISMKPQSEATPGFARARLMRHDYLPDCPNLRFWGKVYAFGDVSLLD